MVTLIVGMISTGIISQPTTTKAVAISTKSHHIQNSTLLALPRHEAYRLKHLFTASLNDAMGSEPSMSVTRSSQPQREHRHDAVFEGAPHS